MFTHSGGNYACNGKSTACPDDDKLLAWTSYACKKAAAGVCRAVFRGHMPLRGSQKPLERFWVGGAVSIPSSRDRPVETILRAAACPADRPDWKSLTER